MTPIFWVWPLRSMVSSFFWAACSSSFTVFRVMLITRLVSSSESPGMISSLT